MGALARFHPAGEVGDAESLRGAERASPFAVQC